MTAPDSDPESEKAPSSDDRPPRTRPSFDASPIDADDPLGLGPLSTWDAPTETFPAVAPAPPLSDGVYFAAPPAPGVPGSPDEAEPADAQDTTPSEPADASAPTTDGSATTMHPEDTTPPSPPRRTPFDASSIDPADTLGLGSPRLSSTPRITTTEPLTRLFAEPPANAPEPPEPTADPPPTAPEPPALPADEPPAGAPEAAPTAEQLPAPSDAPAPTADPNEPPASPDSVASSEPAAPSEDAPLTSATPLSEPADKDEPRETPDVAQSPKPADTSSPLPTDETPPSAPAAPAPAEPADEAAEADPSDPAAAQPTELGDLPNETPSPEAPQADDDSVQGPSDADPGEHQNDTDSLDTPTDDQPKPAPGDAENTQSKTGADDPAPEPPNTDDALLPDADEQTAPASADAQIPSNDGGDEQAPAERPNVEPAPRKNGAEPTDAAQDDAETITSEDGADGQAAVAPLEAEDVLSGAAGRSDSAPGDVEDALSKDGVSDGVSDEGSEVGGVSVEVVGLGGRLEALGRLVSLGVGRVDEGLLEDAAGVLARAGERMGLSGEHTVVTLAGGTGSGKSSLFNAVCGLELSPTGMRRPMTSAAHACVWGLDGAAPLLDWLDVDKRYRFARASALDRSGPRAEGSLRGLVLLDLPDHDSIQALHRAEVDRFTAVADLLIWVVDPQKYADAALHRDYIVPFARHAAVTLIVLNQIDRLQPAEVKDCVSDLRRLLEAEGLADPRIITTSAVAKGGVDDLRAVLAETVASRNARSDRLAADLDKVVERFGDLVGEEPPPAEVDPARRESLVDALTVAAGVPAVAEAMESAYELRASDYVGWPLARWARKLRRDPLRLMRLTELRDELRGSFSGPVGAQQGDVDTALDGVTDGVTAG
ncbi:GTPase family protein, partial [Actinocorallia lasiicapitis]